LYVCLNGASEKIRHEDQVPIVVVVDFAIYLVVPIIRERGGDES